MKMLSKTGTVQFGRRTWQTKAQIATRLGQQTAESIVAHKEASPDCQHEIRPHPDAPNCKDKVDKLFSTSPTLTI